MNKKVFMLFVIIVLSICMLSPLEGKVDKQKSKKFEKDRIQFKSLLLENPNYFGTAPDTKFKAVKKVSYNTFFEEMTCVGLYPEQDLLEAVIKIKRSYGYGGDLCSNGTMEYVTFYIDYGDGNGFVSVGAPAEVNVHNLTAANQGPIYYAVRKAFVPNQILACGTPQIVKIRAILSWQSIPTGADFPPVWGNVMERWVQIRPQQPLTLIPVFTLLEAMKIINLPPVEMIPESLIPKEKFVVMGDLKEIKDYVDKVVGENDEIKKDKTIEKERSQFKKLISKNFNYFGSITTSNDKKEIKKAIYALPESTKQYLFQAAIDYAQLIPGLVYLYKTGYEELKCVGLYPEGDLLEAVIEIKRPYGYGGDLCKTGTPEYVAFYIDWGTGVFQHAATTSVRAHDIPAVNGKHLFYAVRAEIPNIETHLKQCNQENIVKVKAILSWNLDPTPFGPNYSPVWGNMLTKRIQIRPENGPSAECRLEIINEVHVDDISQGGASKGLAIKIDKNNNTVPGVYDRPFGGIIACWGNINVPTAKYYRFRYKTAGASFWNNITDNRKARSSGGWTITRTPDGNGWFNKSDYETDFINYSHTALVQWRTYGKNEKYLLQLQVANNTYTVLSEDEVWILLDNVAPTLYQFGGTPTGFPCIGVAVKDSSGNYKKCGEFFGSNPIKIYGNFKDDYFRSYSLTVFGGNIAVSGVGIGSGRYDGTDPGIGSTGISGACNGSFGQQLNPLPFLNLCDIDQNPEKVKCAYGIRLWVSDRSVVGSMAGYQFKWSHHWIPAYVTFNWDPVDPVDPTKNCPGY